MVPALPAPPQVFDQTSDLTNKVRCRSPQISNCIAAASQERTLERCNCYWAPFLERARELPAVTAHLQIYVPTPSLGLQGKHAEDHGVNLGVDFAGTKLQFWDDHRKFSIARAHRKARSCRKALMSLSSLLGCISQEGTGDTRSWNAGQACGRSWCAS